MKQIKPAIILFLIMVFTTGLIYPLFVTGIARLLFPSQANGSTVTRNGQAVGSALIGQPFNSVRYFWGRLSATPGNPYNAASSGATNYSVLNDALQQQVKDRLTALHAADTQNNAPVPVDLVTASASGLDPHISPAAAYYQAGRVARARGLPEEKVRALIQEQMEQPFLGIIGEPRVNVFMLNLALDSLQ